MTQRDTDASQRTSLRDRAARAAAVSSLRDALGDELDRLLGHGEPLGHAPSFIRAMEAALAAGELNYRPTARLTALAQRAGPASSGLSGGIVSRGLHRGRHGARRS